MSNAPFYYREDGTLVINMDTTLADSDWMRAARLKKLADAGDKKAAKELAEMEATEMVELPDLAAGLAEILAGEKASQVDDPYDDWHDPRMSKEEWIAETSAEQQRPGKFWYSIHSYRGPLAKDHLAGIPIGLLVLDGDEVKTYYLPQFADIERAIKNQINSSGRTAAQEIRNRFDHPALYGDWFSLDKTEVDYESADSLGRHFLREFERFWDLKNK